MAAKSVISVMAKCSPTSLPGTPSLTLTAALPLTRGAPALYATARPDAVAAATSCAKGSRKRRSTRHSSCSSHWTAST